MNLKRFRKHREPKMCKAEARRVFKTKGRNVLRVCCQFCAVWQTAL